MRDLLLSAFIQISILYLFIIKFRAMKNLIHIAAIVFFFLIFGSQYLHSQTFEEFARQREAGYEAFAKEYGQFIEKMNQQYDKYVKQRDKEFTDYLNQGWKEYQLFNGLAPVEKPKPVDVPKFDPNTSSLSSRMLPFQSTIAEPVARPKPEPRLPEMQKTEPEDFPTRPLSFSYYGNLVSLAYDPALFTTIPSTIDNNAISKIWSVLSNTNYNHIVNQLGAKSREMNLNDWGYFKLVQNTANAIYPNSANGANLLAWFLMNRSGYKARAAYFNNEVMLLLPAIQDVYDVNFQIFNGVKYYLIESKSSQVYTYDKDFPDATRIMDMNINSPLNLGTMNAKRTLSFNYEGNSHNLVFEYCKNCVEFYRDYPLSNIQVYFNSVASPVAKESFAQTLLPLLAGRSELDAVGLLLNFTQTAFAYKTDEQQFGYEKFFFAEELLHYPFSDCEDRSVLFAYLVRELMNLKVIGLEYMDHMATAVNFSADPGGDYYTYKSEKFTICDPTFMNAPVGLVMPQYAESTAGILEINNNQYFGSLSEKIWDNIYASNGYRAGNKQDLVFDVNGNAYAAGYFKGNALFGDTKLVAMEQSHGAFVAKYDFKGDLVWVRQPDRQENTIAYHIALDDNQNICVAGTFNGELIWGSTSLRTANADVFIAKYNPNGNLLWAGKAAIDTLNPAMNFMFTAKFNHAGKHLETSLYKENAAYASYGFSFDPAGNVLLTGSSYANTGLNISTMAYESGAEFDPIQRLKEENDKLIAQNYNPVIAGLFAAINLIKYNNVVIPGKAAQEALDRYNPGFKKTAPTVYGSISRINFMKNDQGIILITTENKRSITIDYLKINDNATIKITEFKNGNTQLDVLSGINVGKAIVWYDLNFVRLLKDSGDLLFDYASDHTQKTFNLKKDILY